MNQALKLSAAFALFSTALASGALSAQTSNQTSKQPQTAPSAPAARTPNAKKPAAKAPAAKTVAPKTDSAKAALSQPKAQTPPKTPSATSTTKTANSAPKATTPKAVATPKPVGTPKPAVTSKVTATPKPAVAATVASPLVAPANALVSREVLSNGITLVTRLDKTAPRVAISLLVRAGAVDETPATAGWRRVLTESMLRASLRDGQAEKVVTGTQMQRLAEEVGGRIGASVGDDVIEFWATGDSSNAAALLDLLLTVVQHPRLSEADVKAATERTLERIEGERDDVAALATAALRSQIYRDARGELLAYGLSNTGTLESLNNLTRDKLLDFYKRHFAASRFAVSLAGDLPSTIMRARLEKIAAGTAFPATMVPPSLFASPTQSEPALIVRQMPTRDAWIFVSFRVAASTNKADEPALRVLVSALGEGPSARLQRRMSAQSANTVMGRVFGIDTVAGASLTPRRFGGEMVLFAQTNSAGIDEAKNALLDEVRKLKETAMSETELQRARNFARGSWAVDRESLRDRAFQAGLVAALNPVPVIAPGAASISVANDWDWPSRVSAVSAADVRRVANKYLNAYAVALIMPED